MPGDRSSWLPLPRREERATVVQPPEPAPGRSAGAAIVDCALYEDGCRRGGRLSVQQAVQQAVERDHGFVWIGLHDPSSDAVEEIGRRFGLHPLAVEDAVHAHQRPKLERFGDTLLMVLKTARYVDSSELVEIGELAVFVGRRFVVTVRHGEGRPLAGVRRDVEAHPKLLDLGPSAILYAVADRVVDDYEAVIEGVAVDLDELEADVFSGTRSNPAERIYRLKREVIEFRRAVAPLAAPMQRLADGGATLGLDDRVAEYFRDVTDHLLRDIEQIAAFDELLNGALQANLAQLSTRDNQDMRRISAVVAILAVPTMVFGLYGMNFDHMPELHWRFGYPAVILVVLVVCALLYRQFRRAGWL
ncbi:magnesium and cobalt transport protein CorA [Capillimicrobium parvum]|uniref:Cobalt/magnesium transport protein CorA n=1 Tax=Capillimicrobium parvum TaxID=2884022 RepID=A0A9E6Y1P9_9ACTN|nr:magnesium and cobalt transport protein CorA [Capillimicrobium parvum]UGS38464.1 Cobalt/magnesium transport protein CorA [Capillimicrobium parvum]